MRLPIRGQYPPDRDQLHDQVRAAAGNRCIRCGHPEGDRLVSQAEFLAGLGDDRRRLRRPCDDRCSHPTDEKLRVLTVHHLDGDKANSAWWNLLALCQVCHLTIQAKVIPGRPYLWEHKPWFKVYAAGFYAWWFAGLLPTRAEVEADLDRFLAIGQPWLYPGREPDQADPLNQGPMPGDARCNFCNGPMPCYCAPPSGPEVEHGKDLPPAAGHGRGF